MAEIQGGEGEGSYYRVFSTLDSDIQLSFGQHIRFPPFFNVFAERIRALSDWSGNPKGGYVRPRWWNNQYRRL